MSWAILMAWMYDILRVDMAFLSPSQMNWHVLHQLLRNAFLTLLVLYFLFSIFLISSNAMNRHFNIVCWSWRLLAGCVSIDFIDWIYFSEEMKTKDVCSSSMNHHHNCELWYCRLDTISVCHHIFSQHIFV